MVVTLPGAVGIGGAAAWPWGAAAPSPVMPTPRKTDLEIALYGKRNAFPAPDPARLAPTLHLSGS